MHVSRVLVLTSGGVDSTACIAFYKAHGHQPAALFVDYGQFAVREESSAVRRVATYYEIELTAVQLRPALRTREDGYVPGRNALLLQLALSYAAFPAGIVAIGIHAGVSYPDSSAAVVQAAQLLYDVYTDGCIRVAAPFLTWSKGDVLTFCRAERLPTELTYSCERAAGPCGTCSSCRDRERLTA